MIWLALLLACAGPTDQEAPTSAAPPGATAPDVTGPPAGTDPTGASEPVPGVDPTALQVQRVQGSGSLKVALVGFAVACEADDAWMAVEYVGSPTDVTLTPYVDGIPSSPIHMAPGADGVIRTTEQTAEVAGCEQATWLLELTDSHRTRCAVQGPDAEALLSQHPDCQLR